jgi:hypothetical protein
MLKPIRRPPIAAAGAAAGFSKANEECQLSSQPTQQPQNNTALLLVTNPLAAEPDCSEGGATLERAAEPDSNRHACNSNSSCTSSIIFNRSSGGGARGSSDDGSGSSYAVLPLPLELPHVCRSHSRARNAAHHQHSPRHCAWLSAGDAAAAAVPQSGTPASGTMEQGVISAPGVTLGSSSSCSSNIAAALAQTQRPVSSREATASSPHQRLTSRVAGYTSSSNSSTGTNSSAGRGQLLQSSNDVPAAHAGGVQHGGSQRAGWQDGGACAGQESTSTHQHSMHCQHQGSALDESTPSSTQHKPCLQGHLSTIGGSSSSSSAADEPAARAGMQRPVSAITGTRCLNPDLALSLVDSSSHDRLCSCCRSMHLPPAVKPPLPLA